MSAARGGRVPAATYRLQLTPQFTFRDAAALVGYLDALGISDLYLSPVGAARPGSLHGYDVYDPGVLNPELGGEAGFRELCGALRARDMGALLDVVPNHMCIAGDGNRFWQDVLENGPSSLHARWFDVDWAPPKPDLAEKILLPVLGDQYGRVLEARGVQVHFEDGAFVAVVHGQRLPLGPRSWPAVLGAALPLLRAVLGDASAHVLELESILTAVAHLPRRGETGPERVRERQREKEIVKRRLGALAGSCPEARAAIDAALEELNGRPGDPRSFDRLEALLADQAYRLSHWRVAADEINYRRFFDVNELAAIRVEDPEVFEAVHALPFRLIAEGHAHGLRIDHVDGLFDPADYLRRLPENAYVVVEKILSGDERLDPAWPVDGTTGYEFLNLVNGLFVERRSARELRDVYARFTGRHDDWRDVVYASKKLVLTAAMSSELFVLARRLDRISEQHRFSRDFTLNSLQAGLAEVIACFPVYRTYVRSDGLVSDDDRRRIVTAVREATRRNPATSASLFDFIAAVLLLEHPEGLDEAQQAERLDFVLRFQQLTGPVTAKGLEDTAAYRTYPLASLNEVGGSPAVFGRKLDAFHAENAERLRDWPHALLSTSTHDSKRDEDVRARLDVLSEVPELWEQALLRWSKANAEHKQTVDDAEAPDANAEYLLYQTLFGSWPPAATAGPPEAGYVARIDAYMLKALREAKLHTSWISPNEAYERALADFVARVLDPARAGAFLHDLASFVRPLVRPGLLNSISQTLLKITSPGVPDFYQGTELPEWRLVDPDNRRPVDYALRRRALQQLDPGRDGDCSETATRLLKAVEDGRLKLWVTARALRLRRAQQALFGSGSYQPLDASGQHADHVIAFARAGAGAFVLSAATRFFTKLPPAPVGSAAWNGTVLELPDGAGHAWHDVLTGRRLYAPERTLPLHDLFAHLPFALLERVG